MVGGDQDQGIIGVLVIELHRSLNRVAHFQGIVDAGSGVIGVAGPVNLAALGHDEEALVVVQQLDALLDVVGQLPLACGGVHGVAHGVAVGQLLGDNQGLACAGLQGSGAGLGGNNVVAGLGSHLVVGGHIAAAVVLLELAACEVLEAAVCQLNADLIVVLAAGLVCVESGGGGVVDVDSGDDAHLVALLAVELLGDGLEGHIPGPGLHIDDAALGLFAGSDGGSSRSGVGAEGSAVISSDAAHHGELHEAQVSGDHSAVVLGGAQVEGGGLDLGQAHTVADEEEDVLGLLGPEQEVLITGLLRLGGAGSGGGDAGHQASDGSGSARLQKAAAADLIAVFHNRISFLT